MKIIKYQFPIKHLYSFWVHNLFFIWKMEMHTVSPYSLLKNVSILSLSNWFLEKFFSYECSAALYAMKEKILLPGKAIHGLFVNSLIGRKFVELLVFIYFHSNIILYDHKILHHISTIQEYNTVILWHLIYGTLVTIDRKSVV